MVLLNALRKPGLKRIDRRIYGAPLTVGERTLHLVARAVGWYGGPSDAAGSRSGAWWRLTPVEVIVREEDGSEYALTLTDETAQAMRGIRIAAVFVAAVCWLVCLVGRASRARKRNGAGEAAPGQ
jgi:hypothetical protein